MNAQQLKNSILQLAIQGELVPQDPNDEPASVLLDKIRKEKAQLVNEGKLKKKDLAETSISEDEKPFEIPGGWMWVRLGEIASYITDGEHKTPRRITNYCGYYLLSARNVFNGYINLENVDYVDKEEYENISKHCNPHFGDVLISCSGSVGRTAVVKDNNNYVMVRSAAVISPMYTDSDYLMYTLQTTELQSQIEESSKQTAQANLFQGAIKKLKIPLPPLAEQKRIVAKIEELMPKVEEYGKAQEALDKLNAELPEKLKKSILQEAIEGRLVPQDPDDEPASVLLDKIRKEKARLVKEGKLKKKNLVETPVSEDEKPFDIPENWEWVRVGSVAEYINGLAFKPEDWESSGIPIIRIQNLTDYSRPINYTTKIFDEKYKVQKGDLLFSWSATLDSFIWKGAEAWLNQHIFKVNSYACVRKDYLFFALKAIVANLSNKTHGLTMKHLTRGIFENYPFPLPPLTEQHRIVAKIEELFKKIDELHQ